MGTGGARRAVGEAYGGDLRRLDEAGRGVEAIVVAAVLEYESCHRQVDAKLILGGALMDQFAAGVDA
jgi:hypothetical protein